MRRESRASRIKDFLLGFPRISARGTPLFITSFLGLFLFSAHLSGKQEKATLFSL
jgi:hypothetical protein